MNTQEHAAQLRWFEKNAISMVVSGGATLCIGILLFLASDVSVDLLFGCLSTGLILSIIVLATVIVQAFSLLFDKTRKRLGRVQNLGHILTVITIVVWLLTEASKHGVAPGGIAVIGMGLAIAGEIALTCGIGCSLVLWENSRQARRNAATSRRMKEKYSHLRTNNKE